MSKKPKGHSPEEYAALLVGACENHQACAPLAPRLADVLAMLIRRVVARPTDWSFQYTGAIELRWHNGADRFGSSTKWAGLIITATDYQIRGCTTPKDYSSERGISVSGLPIADAVEMLRILLRLVFATPTPERPDHDDARTAD